MACRLMSTSVWLYLDATIVVVASTIHVYSMQL
nr:MAG TPA: hypothetical protein [Caudoviricetes sp.]